MMLQDGSPMLQQPLYRDIRQRTEWENMLENPEKTGRLFKFYGFSRHFMKEEEIADFK